MKTMPEQQEDETIYTQDQNEIDDTDEISLEEEEEYQGRNWNRIIIAVVFVLIVVILWYVISR